MIGYTTRTFLIWKLGSPQEVFGTASYILGVASDSEKVIEFTKQSLFVHQTTLWKRFSLQGG